MQLADIQEIIDCLPKRKTRFYYFKDRYALLLLRLAVDGATSKKELKTSKFARLLDKEVVKESIKLCRGRSLSAETFDAFWPLRYECYLLSLGVWGTKNRHWDQTTRSGYNLVLQLNFSSKHDEPYKELIDPEEEYPFEIDCHPIAKGGLHTLAWSRLDIELSRSEALIEEIQSDWIRDALLARRRAIHAEDMLNVYGIEMHRDRVIRYVDSILRQHEATWDEAMLSATIWFLRKELGIRSIFYHTHASGAALKKIAYRLPPRSLSTQLPRKFCFTETDDRPGFISRKAKSPRTRNVLHRARFFCMDFQER